MPVQPCPEVTPVPPQGRFQILARTGNPDFLGLPWDRALAAWRVPRLVQVPRGISRHVVRFVGYGDRLYALKELPERFARREHGVLRRLARAELPAVEAVGLVTGRATPHGEPLDAVLITRHLEYALPYRVLFTRHQRHLDADFLDTLAALLVRLHLNGVFWGDCSLSNTLFRRDAGALAAYLVDAETAEIHEELSRGQRRLELDTATTNLGGELMDLEAAGLLRGRVDPVETALSLRPRYRELWRELTREEILDPDDRWLIDRRLARINDLGFDTGEVEVVGGVDGHRLKFVPRIVEEGHHRRRLRQLTGLEVQENQARRLLRDVAGFRACLEGEEGRQVPEAVAAARWLTEAFQPTIDTIPPHLRGKRQTAELYHEVLEHRWFLSEAAGADVGMGVAVGSYVESVLRHAPDERAVMADEDADTGVGGEDGARGTDADESALDEGGDVDCPPSVHSPDETGRGEGPAAP